MVNTKIIILIEILLIMIFYSMLNIYENYQQEKLHQFRELLKEA